MGSKLKVGKPSGKKKRRFAAAGIRYNLRRCLVFNQQRTEVKTLKDCLMRMSNNKIELMSQ
jgi:hypothetical protein